MRETSLLVRQQLLHLISSHPSGMLYGIPAQATSVLVVDPRNDSISFIAGAGTANQKWNDGVYHTGRIFGIPSTNAAVLIIDTDTRELRNIPRASVGGGIAWGGGAVVETDAGPRIVCAPSHSAFVLVIDPATETLSYIGGAGPAANKWHGMVAVGSMAYAIPTTSFHVLTINMTSATSPTLRLTGEVPLGTISPSDPHGLRWYFGALYKNRYLLACPSSAESVLIYDTLLEEFALHGHLGLRPRKWIGGAVVGNTLYCTGQYSASVLVFSLPS